MQAINSSGPSIVARLSSAGHVRAEIVPVQSLRADGVNECAYGEWRRLPL